MTTNNNNSFPGLPNDIDWNGALNAAEAGLPDPAIIARLANEFFTESPSLEEVKDSTVVQKQEPSEASITEVLNREVISNVKITGLPGIATQTQFPPVPPVSIPGIPGGVSASDFSTIPTFSFIEEARSLFTTTLPLPAVPGIDTIKIPTETELKDFPGTIPGNLNVQITEIPKEVSSPQVPGSLLRDVNAGRPANFGFLDEANSIINWEQSPEIKLISPELIPDSIPLSSAGLFDVEAIRRDFPILQERVNGRPLIWLDNAATTHKPQAVIDRLSYFYEHENSNVHRAAHTLAARATDAYEAAREKVRRFLNASSTKEIIFVRGTTEAINLVAQSWGRQNINKDDEIIITWLEHHANIVPWQQLASEKGAKLRIVPVNNQGELLLDEYEKLFTRRTRFVSLAHVSNALGTITPVNELVEIAHRHGVRVLVDGAQAVSHIPVDVQANNADFYVFSGHKIFGPTGIGVVYGKSELLDNSQPWQGGGNMIADVTFERTIYQQAPAKFEAGTGNIADAVGLGAALDYVQRIGLINLSRYEHDLLVYATDALQNIPGLHLIGTAKEKASVLSFVLDGFRTEDVGSALAQEGIAVRAGHHCAQPILRRFGVESTVRPSLAFYNTCQEVDALAAAIWNLKNERAPGLV
ncbi:MAG: family 2A encapsulin nanocompartment cargo protein cysteine desulfurase [Ignavibacteriaceae bacterium]